MNRREAEELLPWYVAGVLSPEEAEAVQSFVDSGEISAADLEAARFVGTAIRDRAADAPRYDRQMLERVLRDPGRARRPETEEPLVIVPEQPHQRNWTAILREWLQWGTTPPLARAAIAAQFALLLGLAFALIIVSGRGAAGDRPAGSEVAGDYTLTFAPGVTEAQIRAALLEHRATIVAGPSAVGLYTIDLDADVDPLAAARALRRSGLVTFLQRLQQVSRP